MLGKAIISFRCSAGLYYLRISNNNGGLIAAPQYVGSGVKHVLSGETNLRYHFAIQIYFSRAFLNFLGRSCVFGKQVSCHDNVPPVKQKYDILQTFMALFPQMLEMDMTCNLRWVRNFFFKVDKLMNKS